MKPTRLVPRASWAFAWVALIARLAAAEISALPPVTPEARSPALLEPYEVTGSRIRRLDLETPSPVVVLTREMIEEGGFAETDEMLRSLAINNNQAIALEGSGNALATGTATTNLRGLGNNNTLVLINGRRASPAGVGEIGRASWRERV
mgnify:FL=1